MCTSMIFNLDHELPDNDNIPIRSAKRTVRGLAAVLNIFKPAIKRAPGRLEELSFTRRETDQNDGQNVIAKRTPTGSAYLCALGRNLSEAGNS
jgi:DNA-binding MarR family transcriptional regulator